MTDMKDYFEFIDEVPNEVRLVLDKFFNNDSIGYDECSQLVDDLYDVGWTCEYGLDADPYKLRKLEDSNEHHAHLMWALNNQI